MNADPLMQKSVTYLTEVETIAQDILAKKQEKLELSNALNKFNEARRALEKSDTHKTFLQIGGTYLEFPKKLALDILKDDIAKASEGVDELYEEIKDKASKLRDLEHEEQIVGIGLKPLSGAEAKAIHKAFGY